MKKILVLWMFSVSIILQGCSDKEILEIWVDGHPFRVEVADDPTERQRGLMERESLDADGGMLFVFPEDQQLSFWMKNTLLPLSIAYIDSSWVIREIHYLEPLSLRPVSSRGSVRYALEVNKGRFAELGIEPGHRVTFQGSPPVTSK